MAIRSIDVQNVPAPVVSQEDLDRVHEIVNENTGERFFLVESDGIFDADNNLLEYKVCIAGQPTCSCGKGDCEHITVALAYQQALDEERTEQSAIESLVRQGVDRATAERVMYARPTQYSELEVAHAAYNNKREPFSILR